MAEHSMPDTQTAGQSGSPIDNLMLAAKRAVQTLRLFLSSELRSSAIGWLALLLILVFSQNGLNVVNSFVGRDFITAISRREPRQFVVFAVAYASVFAVQAAVAAFYRFSEERLRLLWRGWLTELLIGRYTSGDAYYRITARAEIDNPDERLTEDVKSYTTITLSFFLLSLNAAITSLAFLGVLWSITPVLVAAAVAYAVVGSAATILLGSPLVHLTNEQLRKEADLRYHLIETRETAESIATMRAEPMVRDCLRSRVRAVIANNKLIIKVTRNLGFFTNGYNYFIQIIPLLVVAPMYMQGEVEFGVITQAAMAFAAFLGGFSLIVTQFESLTSFAAVTHRLDQIADAIDQARIPAPDGLQIITDPTRVAYSDLTLWTPREERVLINNLTLPVAAGSSVLVTGPDAAAQTALFLATAGLWEAGSGHIRRPDSHGFYFVPKQPITVRCTIRSVLIVTAPERLFSDAEIFSALEKVGIDSAIERVGGLDRELHGPSLLSTAEQRLLVLARVLLAAPRFVFLDRIGGELSPEQVERVYRLFADSSITYLSIGDLEPLAKYHAIVLQLNGDGSWRSDPAPKPAGVAAARAKVLPSGSTVE
jgi:putative ATP-binding cassette transporter